MIPSSREVLQLLSTINQILVASPDPLAVLEPILNALAEGLGSPRAVLIKVNRRTGGLEIAATVGVDAGSRRKLEGGLNDTVVVKVMQTATPTIFSENGEPHPLFEVQQAEDMGCAFLCTPIKLGLQVVGTIGLDRPLDSSIDLQQDQQVLSIIASMIAQSVRLRQRAMEERSSLQAENDDLRDMLEQRFKPGNMTGRSKVMREVFGMVARVAESDATVLIRGESGVGKELVSRSIHYGSLRAKGAFIKVNCAALPSSLIESELFGHEKGAFTGALERRKGRFERADGGSLFLDEIGDLPQTTQALLLRFLQEREFERVGGSQTLTSDVRVITATNRNLEQMVEEGTFREDLYYRLNVYPIHVPALRDRMTDVNALADHFLEKYAKANRKQIDRISTPAIDMLMSYHWPGNVRELENCIERAVLLTVDRVVRSHHLPPTLQTAKATNTLSGGTLNNAIERLEQEMITDALIATSGNRAKAARSLGMTERQMGLRVDRLAIDWRSFRREPKSATAD